VRQVLGAVLLEHGRAADAERTYRADLERVRENGWSLFGLARSLELQDRGEEAAAVRARLQKAWARADITLTSSRIMTDDTTRRVSTSSERFERKTIALPGGVRIDYVEQGKPTGVPVVLLHGFTDSWRSFEPVLPHLPPSLHVYALSQRGHGDSDRPLGGYRVGDFAHDVDAFMEAAGIPRAVLVGHSMGASVAQMVAVDHPERVMGLVLAGAFAPAMHRNPAVGDLWDSFVSKLGDPLDVDFVRSFQHSTVAQPVAPAFLETAVRESLKVPARVWRATLEGLLNADSLVDVERIQASTLIVWGSRDAFTPRSEQDALTTAIGRSRLVIYDGAGHGLHWEEPARFAADVARAAAGAAERVAVR
jgi:pimeloyl-ACP methyl ester carboxylesterase